MSATGYVQRREDWVGKALEAGDAARVGGRSVKAAKSLHHPMAPGE